ncbi:hypothetical protein AUK22_06840 [bacterium CG2_30_54_10]|nr:MAG: hypothetical protein AUK22_06840 [bacterium CG2_30_54_10]
MSAKFRDGVGARNSRHRFVRPLKHVGVVKNQATLECPKTGGGLGVSQQRLDVATTLGRHQAKDFPIID